MTRDFYRRSLCTANNLLLVVFVAFAVACGSDSGQASGLSNHTTADAAGEDASDAGGQDSSNGADAADASGDAAGLRRYDAALDDLGPPASSCSTDIVNADGGANAVARVFVPNYRIDFAALGSHKAFREHIHKIIHEKVVPCIPRDRPAVVVFPESMGLPMLLLGDKAAYARQMSDSNSALTSMINEVQPAFGYYGEKFPDAGLANLFLLAMTDTVVRATYDTFGQLAERYDLYISTTVDLPDFQKTTDSRLVERLGDPDYDVLEDAFEATSQQVYNRQILFGPDGAVIDQTLKTYVTQVELDQLQIAAGDFTDIHPMETPWGPTGVVISKPAWMPDVQDRLDDLGARVIFQPEAFVGGWIKPAPDGAADPERWEPDVFTLGGWNLVQRAPRATHNFVPQLTGNFLDLPIDGQVQIIEKAAARTSSGRFVGQRGPLMGNVFIGPWVVQDPITSNPELTLEQRRDQLRTVGAKLLPDSQDPLEGEYVEGMWAAELFDDGPGPAGSVQTHPSGARLGDTLYVAASDGPVGARALSLKAYQGAAEQSAHTLARDGYDVVRPSVAASARLIHVVAELIGDGENRLLYAAFDPEQGAFRTQRLIAAELVGNWAFHPSIAVSQNALHLSWIKRVGDANRAFYAQTSLSDPFADLAVDTALQQRPANRPVLRANQWDARLAVSAAGLAVCWIDFNNWQWEVMASVSTDGGLNWSQPIRLDTVPDGVEALNSTPTIRAVDERRFLVAWTDARATRPATRVGYRTLGIDPNGDVTLGEAHLVGASAPWNQWHWRPAILTDTRGHALVYEALADDGWSLQMTRLGTDGSPLSTATVVEPSPDAKHFPAVVAGGTAPRVAFEALRAEGSYASEVKVSAIAPQ